MSDDIGAILFGRHPSIPHDLMHVEGILGNAQSVGHTAGPVIGLTPIVSVGIREYDLHTARIDAAPRTRPVDKVFIPALNHAAREHVHIVIVSRSG